MGRILYLVFFAVAALTLLYFIHRYFWVRLIRDTQLKPRVAKTLTIILVALGASVPCMYLLARVLGVGRILWLNVPAFVWLGFCFFLLMALGLVDLIRGCRRLVKKARKNVEDDKAVDPERRLMLKRLVAGTAIATSGVLTGVAISNGLGEFTRPTVEVKLPRLDPRLAGLKIVQISDVHAGPILNHRFIEMLVSETNAMKPDVIVITGDLVDGSVAQLSSDIKSLGQLKSRYGTYFVTGNHEYYSGCQEWVVFLKKLGVRVLTNEHVTLGDPTRGGAQMTLAGVPDTKGHFFVDGHRPSVAKALKGAEPNNGTVLLAHRPNEIDQAADARVGLQLSGHTHGGQIWPFSTLVGLYSPYLAGLHQHNEETQIYVSRGTGFWGPPMRLGAPAELTTIVLT
jgi:predicted MPP superfamily phosphohydrolase